MMTVLSTVMQMEIFIMSMVRKENVFVHQNMEILDALPISDKNVTKR